MLSPSLRVHYKHFITTTAKLAPCNSTTSIVVCFPLPSSRNWRPDRNYRTEYIHIVFTLPAALNPFCLRYPGEAYGMLFNAAWATVRQFVESKQLRGGMIAVLHTWGQTLSFHPHLHCIVPGGCMDKNGK